MKRPDVVCASLAMLLAVVAAAPAAQASHTGPAVTATEGQAERMQLTEMPAKDMFQGAMKKMHEQMMQTPMTGDADRDFALQMIPHHQGAIDMARALLDHGKDPQLREMAKKMIENQEGEIAQLNAWLASHQ